ncbi:MAG: CHASE domain-containing protein, partial [Phycisphaerae bacterium]|nr:CHASE domain-containing protein [Phycisphaerae bacterium]
MPTLRTLLKRVNLRAGLLKLRRLHVLAVLVGGIALSVAGYTYVHRMEQRAVQQIVDGRAHEQAVLVRTTVMRSLESLYATAAFLQTHPSANHNDFHAFTADALARHPELQALGFAPRVADDQRQEFEAAARADGQTDFTFHDLSPTGQLIPSRQRSEYFPVRFIEPESANKRALGFSLDCSPVRERALETARTSGTASVTAPLRLVQEPANGRGFLVLLSVFRPADINVSSTSQRGLLGFASAVFRYDDLLGPALSGLRQQGFDFNLLDSDSGDVLYPSSLSLSMNLNLPSGLNDGRAAIDVAGCHWTLVLQPTGAFVESHFTHQAT